MVTRRTTPPTDWAAGSAPCLVAATWADDSAAATFAAATDTALEGDLAMLALLRCWAFVRAVSAVTDSQNHCRDDRDKGHARRPPAEPGHGRRGRRCRPLFERLVDEAVFYGPVAQVGRNVLLE